MQAIQTKYLPATNTRGYRTKATCAAGSVTVDNRSDSGIDANHKRAAVKLCRKLGWEGYLEGGTLPDGSMAWVFVPAVDALVSVKDDFQSGKRDGATMGRISSAMDLVTA